MKKRQPILGFFPTDTRAQVFYSALLFGISVLLSRSEPVADWESSVFYALYELPDLFRGAFLLITQFGSVYILGILALVYLFTNHYHRLLRLLITGLFAYIVSGFAKDIWGRGRPYELLTNVDNLEYIVRGPGFPSGHVALATAMALVVGHYLPRKYNLLIAFWIVGVGLSRVYLGVHLPTDIIGGFAIGWLAYALFMQVRLYDTTRPNQFKNSSRK